MSGDEPKNPTPSLPLLINKCQIELQRLLQGAAYAIKEGARLSPTYEGTVARTTRTLFVLENLNKQGWELAQPCRDGSPTWYVRERILEIKPEEVLWNVAVDLITLWKAGAYPRSYCDAEDKIVLELPNHQTIAVKAKHLPLPTDVADFKFTKLKDGYAWLTDKAKVLIAKALKNVNVVSEP